MIPESELSAWSLKVSSYRQNHTVILFLLWICYQTVTHLQLTGPASGDGVGRTVLNTVCI